MILANHGIVSSSGGVLYDADALAFMTAASITDNTQKTAINTLVTDLKAYNIWAKMKALYPFVGGSATSHKYNLKDPRDLDVAYRLEFFGGWTHSSNGALPNGTTAYADTKINENTVMTLNSQHLSYYSRTDILGAYVDMGLWDSTLLIGSQMLSRVVYPSSDSFTGYLQDGNNTYVANTDSRGLFVMNRISSSVLKLQKNSTISSFTSNVGAKSNLNFFIGARNLIGAASLYTPRESAFASIGDGLSDTEASDFYTAVQAYQTTLNRQV